MRAWPVEGVGGVARACLAGRGAGAGAGAAARDRDARERMLHGGGAWHCTRGTCDDMAFPESTQLITETEL